MLSLKELTEKNEISGVDIGRLIIENDILLYKQQLGIAAPETAPVTQDVIDKMTDRIETIEEAELLECYVQLQNFIKYAQAMSFAYNQQAQNGLARLIMYLTQAQQVEHARRTLELLPIIMTGTQFREMPTPGVLARRRGVAIVADHFPCRPKCLDANDYFIEPEIDCFQEMMSLEHAESMADKIEYFRSELLIKGLRHQIAYNTLFELIAERIELPDFKVFCTDTEEVLRQVEEYHAQRNELLGEISGEGKAYQNKIRILLDVFRPIEDESLRISDAAIAQVRERLNDIRSFRDSFEGMIAVLLSDGGTV